VAVSSPYTFCDRGDLERRLSAEGVLAALDHDADGALSDAELLGLDDAISDASETVLYYLFAKYDPTVLQQSPWVNRRCVDFAAYVLAGSRCNPVPDSVFQRAERAEALFKEVRDGAGLVPNCPLRRRLAPVWSNTRVDIGYQFKCVRVEPYTSGPPSEGVTRQVDYPASFTFEI
jgi:phage gp36-like protein